MVSTESLGVDNVTRWFGEAQGAMGLRAVRIRRRRRRRQRPCKVIKRVEGMA